MFSFGASADELVRYTESCDEQSPGQEAERDPVACYK